LEVGSLPAQSLSATLLDRQAPKGPTCRVGVFLAALDDAERAEWTEVLGNLTIQATTISRYLGEQGTPLPSDGVRRHRNRQCLCPTS
jgi:hypothetical protein